MLVDGSVATTFAETTMTPKQAKGLEQYKEATRLIREAEAANQRAREAKYERVQLGENTPKDWLGWFALLLVAALLFSSLIINMGRHFGWWTIEQFNDLLSGIRAALSDFGGEGGPTFWIATLIWSVIEIVTGILMVLPLNVFEFIEIFIPDAGSFMGFVDAAILAVVFGLLIRVNPLAHEDRYSSRTKEAFDKRINEVQAKVDELKEVRDEIVERYGIQDYIDGI